MDEATDAADAFGDIDEFDVVLLLDELFQAAMDEADGRSRFDDFFVFDDEVEVDRLRQHRVLRAKGNDSACHKIPQVAVVAAAGAGGTAAVGLGTRRLGGGERDT